MKRILTIFLILWTSNLLAQEEAKDTSKVTLGAYADGYYSYYSNGNNSVVQQHDCIGAYHNNFGLNIGQVTAAYDSKKLRGVMAIHFGDIPQIAWGGQYRNLQEANAGVRLRERLWLDVGFFKTHVGTESFLPKDNLMSIITLGTFYGPFYQSGARLSYDTKNDWHFELHAINGYNRHVDDNQYKTFGLLMSKEFNDKFSMSYSNMMGQENVGLLNDGYLVYQNVYANIESKKLSIQIGLDVATAKQWKIGHNSGNWNSPLIAGLVTAKYKFNERWSLSGRGEVFIDDDGVNSTNLFPRMIDQYSQGVLVQTLPQNGRDHKTYGGLNIYGGTIGVEYKPTPNGFLRIETRVLHNTNAVVSSYPEGYKDSFTGMNPMLDTRVQALISAGFYFDKTFKFAK